MEINRPTDEEIDEYFKYCAKELGYSEESEMVEIATTAAKSMFNGQFDRWRSMNKSEFGK